MKRVAHILPALQLARIALVFTAIADIWLIAMLADAGTPSTAIVSNPPDLPLWAMLLTTAGVAGGLYMFGMSLNDVLDFRHDRTFAPDRPLPSGRIGVREAVAVTVAALLLGLVAAVPLGTISTILAIATAALILFYNSFGKHLPAAGIITLGIIRGVHMLIAAPSLDYCWPIWLTISHVIGISAAAHRLEGKRPLLQGLEVWITVGAWAFTTLGLLAWMSQRNALFLPEMPWIWVGPTLAAIVFLVVAIRTVATRPANPAQAGGLLIKRGLLWLIVYDASWLLSAGLWWQAAAVAALLPAALASMMLMRQLKSLLDPPDFQRDAPPPTSGR